GQPVPRSGAATAPEGWPAPVRHGPAQTPARRGRSDPPGDVLAARLARWHGPGAGPSAPAARRRRHPAPPRAASGVPPRRSAAPGPGAVVRLLTPACYDVPRTADADPRATASRHAVPR